MRHVAVEIMATKDYQDCEGCNNLITGYNADLCKAMQMTKPVTYMRSPLSQCGPEKMLFEPVKKYSEFDDNN